MKNTKQVKGITMLSAIESTLAEAGIDVSKRLIVITDVKGSQNVDWDLDKGFVEFIKENMNQLNVLGGAPKGRKRYCKHVV